MSKYFSSSLAPITCLPENLLTVYFIYVLRWLKTVIFLWEAWVLKCTSAWGNHGSNKRLRDSTQDSKLANLTTKSQGLLCETFASAKFNEMFVMSLIFTFKNIHALGSKKKKKKRSFIKLLSGLKIMAGHWTVSSQDDYLSGQNLGLVVILTGHACSFQLIWKKNSLLYFWKI